MATAPETVQRLVDRSDQNRKVFLSGNSKEEQLPKAKTRHERGSLQRQISATDKQTDALVYELYGLTEEVIRIVEGEPE